MNKITNLRCISCSHEYKTGELEYTCPYCGHRQGTLEFLYDYNSVRNELTTEQLSKKDFDIWRYLPLLPIEKLVLSKFPPPLKAGGTPLYQVKGFPIGGLWVKDDGGNPTGSYKDRATSLVIIKAQEKDARAITCASTGNAASSLAGFAAAAGLDTYIFVPAKAPKAKIAQLLVYGTHVFAIKGSYDMAYDLALKAADRFGWYNRSAAINPYLVEGKKTGAFEVSEQLDWKVPDYVLVSVGDGSIISGLCKGFFELVKIGIVDRTPTIIGVQAEKADPIAQAFEHYKGDEVVIRDQEAQTMADSISVGSPRDIVKAVKYVHKNKGFYIRVSDEEILKAIKDLAQRTGVFSEPAGAASYAGFLKLLDAGGFSKDDRIVVFATGNGLKDIQCIQDITGKFYKITPQLEEIERILANSKL